MISVSAESLPANWPDVLIHLAHGETVLLTDADKTIAEIRPLAVEPPQPRTPGLAKGLIVIPDSFFDPLPDDELALWNGEGP